MSINADIQKLEPGAKVTLFVLDARPLGGGLVRFHGHRNGPIVWQGNTYAPWPIGAEGFERTSGQQPTPKLSVGNVDSSITALCLAYDDLVGAIIVRKQTFVQYLDAVNFPGGNPTADNSQELPEERWYIERKPLEIAEQVEFELASALDFQSINLPGRQIIANNCPFTYRGEGCAYIGPPVATEMDVPTSNLSLDKCGKRLGSCELRIWPDGILNYGGYPAAGLVRV